MPCRALLKMDVVVWLLDVTSTNCCWFIPSVNFNPQLCKERLTTCSQIVWLQNLKSGKWQSHTQLLMFVLEWCSSSSHFWTTFAGRFCSTVHTDKPRELFDLSENVTVLTCDWLSSWPVCRQRISVAFFALTISFCPPAVLWSHVISFCFIFFFPVSLPRSYPSFLSC